MRLHVQNCIRHATETWCVHHIADDATAFLDYFSPCLHELVVAEIAVGAARACDSVVVSQACSTLLVLGSAPIPAHAVVRDCAKPPLEDAVEDRVGNVHSELRMRRQAGSGCVASPTPDVYGNGGGGGGEVVAGWRVL